METPEKDKKFWRLGFLYYNPDDPREFVPRRRGYGDTINFAHRAGVFTFFMLFFPVVLVLIVVGVPFLLLHK